MRLLQEKTQDKKISNESLKSHRAVREYFIGTA
jgi:hypothetical protein